MKLRLALLACALSGTPRPSAAAVANEDVAEPAPRIAVQVDHSQLLSKQMKEAADKSRMWVREDVTAALNHEFGYDVIDVGGDEVPTIIVRLGWVEYERSIYRIELETQWPGHPPEPIGSWEYRAYNNTVLIRFVLDKLPAAIERLAQRPSPLPPPNTDEPSDPTVQRPEASGGSTEAPPETDEDDPATIGPVGISGIAVAVGGLGLTGVALGLAARRVEPSVEPTQERSQVLQEPNRGRYAWPAVGLGLTAAGITMLIVDLTVLRKRRQRALSVVPSIGPSNTGAELRLRF